MKDHKQLLNDACRSCDVEICFSVDLLSEIIHYLTRQLSSKLVNQNQSLEIIRIGTKLFYLLLSFYNEKYNEYMKPLAEKIKFTLR